MQLDKVQPQDIMTFLWVGAALVAFALAVWSLVEKIKKHSQWRTDVDAKLDAGKKRLDAQEEGQRVICRGILALLSHEINGNSVEKLKSAQQGITDYLIER
jgi:hypothetical protein